MLFCLKSINLSVSSLKHASNLCFSRKDDLNFENFGKQNLPSLYDNDVIAASYFISLRQALVDGSHIRIFLSKWPLIIVPTASAITKSWHFDPANNVWIP